MYSPNINPNRTRTPTNALKCNKAAAGVIIVNTLAHNILWPKTRLPPTNSANRPPGSSVNIYPQKKQPRIGLVFKK